MNKFIDILVTIAIITGFVIIIGLYYVYKDGQEVFSPTYINKNTQLPNFDKI